MQTMQSRVYTNAILTVIAIFLAVLALQNFAQWGGTAVAQDRLSERERLVGDAAAKDKNLGVGDLAVADANKEIARSIREIAGAMKDASEKDAQASAKIAQALQALAGGGGK